MKALIKHTLVVMMIVMCTAISAHSTDVPDPFGGIGIDVAYSDHGLWNDRATGRGLEYNGTPVSYPGSPWQQVSIAYNGTLQDSGNYSFHTWGLQVPLTPFEGGSGFGNIGSTTVWNSGDLRIMKEESWYREKDPAIMKIDVVVTNEGCEPIKEFIFMHAVDPDQDIQDYGDYRTFNDVFPSEDFVFSAGRDSAVAYGRCDSVKQDLGHTWWSTSPFASLYDRNLLHSDETMHLRHVEDVIYPGETIRFSFVFIAADDFPAAYSAYSDYVDTQCDCGELRDDYKENFEYINEISVKVEDLMERIDPAEAASALQTSRDRIILALEWLGEQQLLEVKVAGIRLRFQLMRQPDSIDDLVDELYQRVIKREEAEIHRLQQVVELITMDGCQSNALASHFGEQREAPCGHCSWCRHGKSELPPRRAQTISDALWQEVEIARQEHAELLEQPRILSRFLCGITSPRMSRNKLTGHPLFGSLESISFAEVLGRAQKSMNQNL